MGQRKAVVKFDGIFKGLTRLVIRAPTNCFRSTVVILLCRRRRFVCRRAPQAKEPKHSESDNRHGEPDFESKWNCANPSCQARWPPPPRRSRHWSQLPGVECASIGDRRLQFFKIR